MTKATHHQAVTRSDIAFILSIIAITVTVTAILLIPAPFPTYTTVEMTKTELPNTIFEHKDTGIQMTFFGTTSNSDYYYLKSIHDYHWIWSGTPQEFTAQFQPIEEQKEPPQ